MPGPLAHGVLVDYDSLAMLSRAQEARVGEILGSHLTGTLPAYCLEHLAATAQLGLASTTPDPPRAHRRYPNAARPLAPRLAFVRSRSPMALWSTRRRLCGGVA
jgi:hypothetical protein